MRSGPLNLLLTGACIAAAPLYANNVSPAQPVLEKAVKVVQSAMGRWFTTQQCASCHHTALPTLAIMEAPRRHGIAVDEASARQHYLKSFGYLTNLDMQAQGYDSTDAAMSETYTMLGAHAAGLPRNTATAALTRMIATRQTRDGRWRTLDYRPPQTGSPFTTTAITLRALQLYMPEELAAETRDRVRRAAEWLRVNKPADTESRAYQLMGLYWAGADAPSIKSAGQQLLAEQRSDGGWAQIPRRGSDAYATGEALFALHTAGALGLADPAFQRGIAYLLQTQKPDGSWHVVSRIHDNAPISPPFFQTGFPHGKDQFTSMSGTSWAIRALSLTMPAAEPSRFTLAELVTPDPDAWVRTALFGTAADLRTALASGMDSNSRTAGGTTALMLAAADPDKVRILIDAGADVNARATKTGSTPIMVAAAYGNSRPSVSVLIDRGAAVINPPGKKAINNGSALMNAVVAGDRETVAFLLRRGADPNQKSLAFQTFTIWPLLTGTLYADEGIVSDLIQNGAKLDTADPMGGTALFAAALNAQPAIIRLLAKHGARVNDYDTFGMTPLLWASTLEHTDGGGVQALLEAGANPNTTSKDNRRTPLSQAKKYGNTPAVEVLEAALAQKAEAKRR